jgi:uncharacterized protein (DUF924 family)
MNDSARAVLDEWFGDLDANGKCADEKIQRWFRGGPEFDAHLTERYGALVEQAMDGGLEDWDEDPLSAVALVLLLDQFSRNVFRNSGRMYAGDERAQSIAQRLLDDPAKLERLPFTYRSFVCMPLMHAENVPLQERCVAEFEQLARVAPR